jgi:hypothetical protein
MMRELRFLRDFVGDRRKAISIRPIQNIDLICSSFIHPKTLNMKQILLAIVITCLYRQTSFAQQTALQNKSHFEMEARLMNQNNFIQDQDASRVFTGSAKDYTGLDSIPGNMHNRQLAEQYLTKSRNRIPLGFVLLGAGIGAAIGGWVGMLDHYDILDGSGSGYVVLWLAGIGSAVSGTILVATGFHYKRKAQLLLQNDNISKSFRVPIKSNVISIGVAFNLK